MPKKIIILEKIHDSSGESFRYVFWATVPESERIVLVNAAATSVFKEATAEELQEIRSGSVVEKSDVANYPKGTAASVIKADLISRFNAYQSTITARKVANYYGVSYDGTSWSV